MARVTLKKGGRFGRLEGLLENPERVMKQIGALMVAESAASFREQKFDGKIWPARGEINVFGIIADFSAGKAKPPARRFEKRPALIDTGRLAGSISFRLAGQRSVEVGTNLKYAPVHQHGGKVESETITEKLQAALWKWLKNQGDDLKAALGFLLNPQMTGKKLKGEVPQRRFLGITRDTITDVQEVIRVAVVEGP